MQNPISKLRAAAALAVLFCGTFVGSAYAATTGYELELVQSLVVNDPAAASNLGYAVAVDGDTAVISAWQPSLDELNTGAVYVFTRKNGAWTQSAKLTPTGSPGSHAFGFRVAISGDTIAVSDDIPGRYLGPEDIQFPPGAIYVYHRSGENWSLQARLISPSSGVEDQFGHALALREDTLVTGNGYQSAFVFQRSGTVWTLQSTLTTPPQDVEFPAQSFALSATTLIIGAYGNEEAYVYTRSGNSWSLQTTLRQDIGAEQGLGSSVVIDGDTAIIGAINFMAAGTTHSSGAAYAFKRTGSAWISQGALPPPGEVSEFARQIFLEGDRAIIPSREGSFSSQFAAIYTRSGGNWSLAGVLTEVNPNCQLAFQGSTAIVGRCGTSSAEVYALKADSSASPPRIDAVTGDNYLNLADTQTGIAITGNAEPGATVKVTLGKIVKTGIADAAGRWTVNLSGAQVQTLADGKLIVSAFQTDVSGNISQVRTLSIRKDTVPPAPPSIDPVTGDDVVLPAERKTGLNITGRAPAGAALVVKVGAITNTTTAGKAGTWKVSLDAKHAGNLPIGNVQIIASVSDAAGNTTAATHTFQNR